MAIFGRKTARQRLRRATRESLTIPAFSSPVDCTPWVTGGLWPAELSTVTDESAAVAQYLRADLQRIADAANIEVRNIRRTVLADVVRQAEEARVINSARAFATRRVESAVRHLRNVVPEWPTQYLRLTNLDHTDSDTTQGLTAATTSAPDAEIPSASSVEPEPAIEAPAREASPAGETDQERIQRRLEFVARQEPGLRWAVGDRADGTTVVVTDLACGWIPPGIVLPSEVRLLTPERRTGNAIALLGQATRSVAYTPGTSLGSAAGFDAVEPSPRPRELPMIDDLGWLLGEATHWRDGLPRMVHTLAKAGAAGTGVVEAELDLLRVHLDTARYQVLAQYPDVDAALLLNCLLLAATEGIAGGDTVSANYHFAWFQALSAAPASRWTASP